MVPRMPTTTLTAPINIHSPFIHDDSRPTGGRSDTNSRGGDREYQTLGVGCQGAEGGSAEGSAIAWIQIFVDKLLFAIAANTNIQLPGFGPRPLQSSFSYGFREDFVRIVHSSMYNQPSLALNHLI